MELVVASRGLVHVPEEQRAPRDSCAVVCIAVAIVRTSCLTKATGEFASLYEFLLTIDVDNTVATMTFFTLQKHHRPVVAFCPAYCLVAPFAPAAAYIVWPLSRATTRRTRARGARVRAPRGGGGRGRGRELAHGRGAGSSDGVGAVGDTVDAPPIDAYVAAIGGLDAPEADEAMSSSSSKVASVDSESGGLPVLSDDSDASADRLFAPPSESEQGSDCFEFVPDPGVADGDARPEGGHTHFGVVEVEDAPRLGELGAAGHALDVAPPPPIDAAPARFAGEATVWLPNGAKITAYSYDIVECMCSCKRHGSCVKTKRRTGAALLSGNPAQGRP